MENSHPTDNEQPTVSDEQMVNLQRAGKLLAGLAELRWRNFALCDVLLQTESLANETVLQAVNEVVAGEAPRETAEQIREVAGHSGQAAREARGVWAHAPVLAAASLNLHTMLSQNTEERTKRIIVQDVELESIRAIVDYLYSPASLTVTVENAPVLVAAANSMKVDGVRDTVCDHLMNALAPNNALGIHTFALENNCDALAAAVGRYIDDNAQTVLSEAEFLEISPDTLAALLDSDRLAAPEELVLDAVIRWTQHRPQEERRSHLYRLLQHVRLVLVPTEKLLELIRKEPLASAGPNVLQQVFDAIADNRDQPERRIQAAARAVYRPRQQNATQSHNNDSTTQSQTLLLEVAQSLQSHNTQSNRQSQTTLPEVAQSSQSHFANTQSNRQSQTMPPEVPQSSQSHFANTQSNRQSQTMLPEVPQSSQSHFANIQSNRQSQTMPPEVPQSSQSHFANTQSITQSPTILPEAEQSLQSQFALLVAGGRVEQGCSDSVLIYSLSTGQWESATVLPAPRNSASAVLLDSRVYIIGGDDATNPTRTVFVYDALTNSWTTAPELITARCWQGAAALDGRLYAVGGWDCQKNNLNLVEALDPREKEWQTIASMKTGRRALGVAAMGGMLYAVGGHDGRSPLNSIERYDPRADKWMSAEPMAKRRGGVGLGVVNDVLYAVGGVARKSIVMQSMERYRVGSGWELAPDMAVPRRGAAVTAHDGRLYAAGGFYDRSGLNNSVSMFDTTTGAWTDLPALPAGRAAAAAVVVAWPPLPTT